MLVLSRKTAQTITITDKDTGEDIVIHYFGTMNAKIGIEASERFSIARTELIERDAELTEAAEPVIPRDRPPIPLVNSSWVRDLHEAKRTKR